MIRTEGLVKQYPSGKALDDVDLVVPAGAVLGLVGPNGAGKTTLLSILAGLRRPTAGTATIDAERSRVAVLPDAPRFDPWLTGREVIDLARRLTAPGAPKSETDRVLAEAALTDAADRRVAGYSRGMLQRLGLAATVVGHPEVLLLDEPASALDPIGRRDVLDLVRRMRGSATVVFSSHILADVQDVSDHLAILDRGRLQFQGPAADLLGAGTSAILVRTRDGAAAVERALSAAPWAAGVERLDDRVVRVRVDDLDAAERRLPGVLAETGVRVVSIAPDTPTLEDVFLEVTR
jgi:ABC-2 type transport system ATP-binding protein